MNGLLAVIGEAIVDQDVPNHSIPIDNWGEEGIIENEEAQQIIGEIIGEYGESLTRENVYNISAILNPKKLFIATIMWGYGKDNRGPYRLNKMLETSNFEDNIRWVVDQMQKGVDIAEIYDNFIPSNALYHINKCGPSFGTKFLYFIGKSIVNEGIQLNYFPLILDDNVKGVLKILGYKFSDTGKDYKKYLQLMASWADELRCAPDQIELFFFKIKKEL